MREPPKKREIRSLNRTFTARPIKRLGNAQSLRDRANGYVDEVKKKVKTEDQLRMDRELAKNYQQFEDEYDSEFWVCLVFQTRAQREAFVAALGERGMLPADVSKDDKYLSGTALAKQLNVTLPPGPTWRPEPAPKKRWADLARDITPGD